MGDLIFISRAKPAIPRALAAGHSAEIHFFTGVRYYRMEEPAEAPAQEGSLALRRRSPQQRRAAKRPRTERERKKLA